MIKIFVDADACPNVIKDMLYKAAIRCNCQIIFVANQFLSVRRHQLISMVQVQGGIDMADKYIAEKVEAGDLVITADIPFASDVIAKDAFALNPRGKMYTKDNIRQCLGARDFMEELRSSGTITGGPKKIDQSHLQKFANELDKFLTLTKKEVK